MKKVILVIFSVITLAGLNFSCNLIDSKGNSTDVDSSAVLENAPKIEFVEEIFDFGKLKEGDIVEHIFVFKNVGKSPLQILNVQVQCGCTVASKPEAPIGVGQKDMITVRFNSTGKVGVNKKFVTVHTNGFPPQTVISFTAEVAGKGAPDSVKAVLDKLPKIIK